MDCTAASTMPRWQILVSDGEDIRKLPLWMRKTNLARNSASTASTSRHSSMI